MWERDMNDSVGDSIGCRPRNNKVKRKMKEKDEADEQDEKIKKKKKKKGKKKKLDLQRRPSVMIGVVLCQFVGVPVLFFFRHSTFFFVYVETRERWRAFEWANEWDALGNASGRPYGDVRPALLFFFRLLPFQFLVFFSFRSRNRRRFILLFFGFVTPSPFFDLWESQME